jgi:hypothetical protein
VSGHRILEPLAFALQRLFHQKVVDVAALQGNEVSRLAFMLERQA